MSLVSLMRFCKRRFLLGQRKPRPVTRRRPLLLESLEQRTVPSANLLSKTVAMQPGAQGSSIASPDHLVTSLFYDVLNRQPSRSEIAPSTRRGSKRDELLKVIREGGGLSRGEILEKMGLKGNKSDETSVSNALTALTKGNQVTRRDRKYVAA